MNTITSDLLLAQLRWRYATKKFDPSRTIAPAAWTALEEALTLSPSSYGLQPYRFVVVTDPKLRRELRAVSSDQPQITDASHLVVFARKLAVSPADIEKFIKLIADTRGQTRISLLGFHNGMVEGLVHGPRRVPIPEWTARQTYLALGILLASAALLGIDACPIEGIKPERYDEILGLTANGFGATNVCTLGYRAADDKYAAAKKVRFPVSELIEHR